MSLLFVNKIKNNLLNFCNFLKYIKHVRYKTDIVVDESVLPSLAQIKKKLKNFNLNFEDGYTCLTINCLFCNTPSKKSTNTNIFINKTSGFYLCSCNKYSGNWEKIENYINVKKSSRSQKLINSLKESLLDNRSDNHEWDSVCNRSSSIDTLDNNDFLDVVQSLKIPNLQKDILEAINTRIDTTKKKLYFPLYNIASQIVGFKTIKLHSREEITVPNSECYGFSSIIKGKSSSIILVTRILDLITLAHHKINTNVICLPHGITILPQQILPFFESYDKIIIWFGNDVHSWNAAKHFAKKLDEQRCMIVRSNEKYVLPSEVESSSELKKILANITPVWHKSITTFASLRQDVLFDLQNIEKIQGVKWTRYPTLNKILKGHRRGELTVLTGPTGSGKTTFISEYSLDLAMQGVNTLWGSFEIRNARLARMMLQQMAGIPLDENLDQFDFWADKFEQLPIYFMTFHGQQSIKIVMEAVEHAAYVHDIAHVIIDNVQFMLGLGDDTKHMDRFWKQDVIVAAFRTFATKKNCHVTLVIHPRKERETEELTLSSIFGGAKASQEADNVLLIQDKRLTSIRGKKYLQVAKNRYSGDLGVMPLDYDKPGLSYRQRKKAIDDSKKTVVNKTEEEAL